MSEDQIRVLLMDPDPESASSIRSVLETEGSQVFESNDCRHAVEIAEAHPLDALILDVAPATGDGWMVLMELRTVPAFAEVPVMVVTERATPAAKVLAFKEGVLQYVTKPFSPFEIAARVESMVKWTRKIRAHGHHHTEAGLQRLPVRKGGRTVLLDVNDIVYFSSRNKSTYAHTSENQYLTDLTLGDLEDRLAHQSFARVHRGYLMNLSHVREILRQKGAFVVVADDRDETQIVVSRRQIKGFRAALGI